MSPQIKFSHCWNNKLNCNVFTTIRNYSAPKWDYYWDNVGKTFDIILNGAKIGQATLNDARVENYAELDFYLLATDTGCVEPEETDNIFKKFGVKEKVIVLLFKKI